MSLKYTNYVHIFNLVKSNCNIILLFNLWFIFLILKIIMFFNFVLNLIGLRNPAEDIIYSYFAYGILAGGTSDKC